MDLTFEGKSDNLSLEEAIKDAISKDPKDKPGTDFYNYRIVETRCSFGGIAEAYTLYVTIRRPK